MWGDDKAGALSGGISAQLCCHSRSGRSPLSAQGVMQSSGNGSGPCNPQGSVVQLFLIAWGEWFSSQVTQVHNTVARVVGE